MSLLATTAGVGSTVMVNVLGTPAQRALDGVIVMLAVFVVLLLLIAVDDGTSPVPLAASPIDGSLLVQVKFVPLKLLVIGVMFAVRPLHNAWLGGCITFGAGFIVMVKVL